MSGSHQRRNYGRSKHSTHRPMWLIWAPEILPSSPYPKDLDQNLPCRPRMSVSPCFPPSIYTKSWQIRWLCLSSPLKSSSSRNTTLLLNSVICPDFLLQSRNLKVSTKCSISNLCVKRHLKTSCPEKAVVRRHVLCVSEGLPKLLNVRARSCFLSSALTTKVDLATFMSVNARVWMC